MRCAIPPYALAVFQPVARHRQAATLNREGDVLAFAGAQEDEASAFQAGDEGFGTVRILNPIRATSPSLHSVLFGASSAKAGQPPA